MSSVRFLAEQDGPPERELKTALQPLLHQAAGVQRAFLVLTQLEDSDAPVVCLAILGPEDGALAGSIGRVFASMFGSDAFLDILFLGHDREPDVAAVCRPFYG